MTNTMPRREPELSGQIVVVIGGSAGIGLETARRARAEGADVIITGRDPERLERAARDVGARRTAAFDADDEVALTRFFDELPDRIDHVLLTAGRPHYEPLLEMNSEQVRHALGGHAALALAVARNAAGKIRPGGALCSWAARAADESVATSDSSRRPPPRCPRSRPPSRSSWRRFASTSSPPDRRHAVVGFAPRRRSRGSADELRMMLPIGRVVGPADVAALAVHLISNTALTGATYDIDGGQQFVG